MKKKIMIIDDEQSFVETIFKPKLSQWNVEYEIISNESYYDIKEESLADFTSEVVSIANKNKDNLVVIFLDLGLNRSEASALLGFKLGQSLRDVFFDIPIVALTRFDQAEIMEEGYLYDFDRYITKTEFSNLGSLKFNGLIYQVIRKREKFIDRIPMYYRKIAEKTGADINSITAFGHTFTWNSKHFENVLQDAISIKKKIDNEKAICVVLFSDLCDSTKIKEKQGFIEGLYLTKVHNELVTEVIRQNDGNIVKYIGDCVMARFDYEGIDQLDARPINAAIKINEALDFHNKEYRKNAEFKIKTKIGISSGKVVDFYGNDPQGSCVDLAARIQSLAKPRQILIPAQLQVLIKASDVESTLGKAVNRDPEEYFSGPHEIKLKGFERAQKIYEIFWSEDVEGVLT